MYKWNFDDCVFEINEARFYMEITESPEKYCPPETLTSRHDISSFDLWKMAFKVQSAILHEYYKERERARLKAKFAEYYTRTLGVTSKVRNAVKSGKLYRPDECHLCGGTTQIEGHHEDYNKALDVLWLCNKCHIYLHKGKLSLLPHPMYQPIYTPVMEGSDDR